MPPKRPASIPIRVSSRPTSVTVGQRSNGKRARLGNVGSGHGNSKALRDEFIKLLSNSSNGVSNSQLKRTFGSRYNHLPSIMNYLIKESRLTMSKRGEELFYNFVREEVATKFSGLDVSARMVYQLIEKAGNVGIWTKDVRIQSNIQQQALNKIFKILESRKLIKPIKAVTAKAKKLYMLYDLAPAKEITGGPWYTELEFDHGFVSELQNFILHCIQKLNGGKGVTLKDIESAMKRAKVSRVQLSISEVSQLVQTLAFDYMIEQNGVDTHGDVLFVVGKKCTSVCNFKWWAEALCPDFHFRDIRFEDDVILSRHEPHHHTSS